MYKRVFTLLLAGILLFSVPVAAAPSEWAKAEVDAAIVQGIVPAGIQGEYQKAVTREEFCEMAMLIWCKLTGGQLPEAESVFTDTANPSVAAAKSLGIVKGVSETEFAPFNPVTRQEMSVMLKNTLAVSKPAVAFPETYPNTFPDGDKIADWAMEAVQCMHLFAVMLGDENGNINPLGNTTREQAILLAYRLLMTQAMTTLEYVEKFLMPLNSNTHDNMLGGAFVGCTADKKQFYVGQDGIYQVGKEEPVVSGKAHTLAVFNETVYYIGEDDGVYMLSYEDGAVRKVVNDKTDSYSAYDGFIYYRNLSDGGRLYKCSLETGVSEAITEKAAELLEISQNGNFFSDGEAIYKLADDGSAQLLFTGKNKNLCVKDEKIYFLNTNGVICTIDLNGTNYCAVARKQVSHYNFTRDCLIGLGLDGRVYKIAFDGKYTILLDAGTYVSTVTYDDYVYALDAEGGIYKFSNNGTEKAKIY